MPADPLISTSQKRRLLVICAHADDETFGCGGTIALEGNHGNEVTVCCLTGTPKRHDELQRACDILGAKPIAHEGKDFSLELPQVTQQLIPIIQKVRPDVIITHSVFDYHPDHQVVHRATLQAAEWAGHATLEPKQAWRPHRLLSMEINNLLPAPTYFVDISEVIDLKRQAIIAYHSQERKTKGYYHAFNMQKAQLRGLQADCEFAEVYLDLLMPIHGPFYSPSPTVDSIFL